MVWECKRWGRVFGYLTYVAGVALIFGQLAYAQEEQVVPGPIEQYADESMFVASPAEILRLRQRIQDTSAAKHAPTPRDYAQDIPSDVMTLDHTFDLSMEPGEAVPRIYIARYQSTSISFIDAYGNHWPIRKISSWLDGLIAWERAVEGVSRFVDDDDDEEAGQGRGNDVDPRDPQSGSFTVTSLQHGVVGNITVYLHGMAQPVTLVLVTKPALFHSVATVRIGSTGPNSNYAQLFQAGANAAGAKSNPDLNNALHGVSPVDSQRLVMEGANGKAWTKGDHVYVQTDLAIFSPTVLESTHSGGRYKAYKLPKTTRILGTNAAGQTVSVRLMRSPSAALQGVQR